jgi:hypothetical protein
MSYATALLAHCVIEGPPSVIQLLAPAVLFPDVIGNDAATMMARGVGGALFALTYVAWNFRAMPPSPAYNVVIQSLFVYHVFALLIVGMSKTVYGLAGPMELLSNVVHLGLAAAFWPSRR